MVLALVGDSTITSLFAMEYRPSFRNWVAKKATFNYGYLVEAYGCKTSFFSNEALE